MDEPVMVRGHMMEICAIKLQIATSILLIIDEDECSASETNHCQQLCVNTPGSYVCQCNDGFRLNDDLSTCDGMSMLHYNVKGLLPIYMRNLLLLFMFFFFRD